MDCAALMLLTAERKRQQGCTPTKKTKRAAAAAVAVTKEAPAPLQLQLQLQLQISPQQQQQQHKQQQEQREERNKHQQDQKQRIQYKPRAPRLRVSSPLRQDITHYLFSASASVMLDIDSFDAVFGSVGKNHYPTHLVSQVQAAQDQLGDKLFFHQLLDALHIQASHLYPPKNAKEFRELHRLITHASCAEVQKQSLLYYLLKDCSLVAKDNDAASETFIKSVALPKKYTIAMQGFWSLDKLRFDEAVEYLTHPVLEPVFSPEVLSTLLRADEDALALAFYVAVKPSLADAQLLDRFFRALCRANLAQAFFFMRRQSSAADTRQPLFEALIEAALSLPAGEERRNKAAELVDLPFNAQEETWFRDYLTKNSGRTLELAQDALLVRLMAKGQYADALDAMGKGKASKANHEGLRWENIAENLNKAVGERRRFDGWTVQ